MDVVIHRLWLMYIDGSFGSGNLSRSSWHDVFLVFFRFGWPHQAGDSTKRISSESRRRWIFLKPGDFKSWHVGRGTMKFHEHVDARCTRCSIRKRPWSLWATRVESHGDELLHPRQYVRSLARDVKDAGAVYHLENGAQAFGPYC